jgi:hypothetical protein
LASKHFLATSFVADPSVSDEKSRFGDTNGEYTPAQANTQSFNEGDVIIPLERKTTGVGDGDG